MPCSCTPLHVVFATENPFFPVLLLYLSMGQQQIVSGIRIVRVAHISKQAAHLHRQAIFAILGLGLG